MTKERPNPDQLISRSKEEHQDNQGKLKIYLGAAPGVGKTYEMLHDGLEKRAHGLDVIIGIAESHGRHEIDQILSKFETLPLQSVLYRDKRKLEFDLDAALKRHPGLILVDEMAHTNVPGLRHTKRWQDIKELLDRGIDVYTTLNVQHIESLNDDVAQIIGISVYETVPDSMIKRANTIELVDLPPEDLLVRLKEGKVYIPHQAELAIEHFFRLGNLIALRELALRVTAERVGTDVLWYRQGEGIKEIWPVKDKILVCVGPKPDSLKLIRVAKRLAANLQTEWMAVYVETLSQSSDDDRTRAIQHLRVAELLGAKTHVLSGFDIVTELLRFAREENVTQLVIGKHIVNRWRDWFRRNLADEIVRYSKEINVYIITGAISKRLDEKKTSKSIPWKIYGIAIAAVGVVSALGLFLYQPLDPRNLIVFYLLSVTLVAFLGYRGPAVLASILSIIAYNALFLPPFFPLAMSHFKYVFTAVTLFLMMQINIHLTLLMRRKSQTAYAAHYQMVALYTLSQKLNTTRGVDDLLILGTKQIAEIFNGKALVLLSKNNRLEIQASFPDKLTLSAKEIGIAQWVYESKLPAGVGTDTLASSDALYLPIIGSSEILGVFWIKSPRLFTPDEKSLLESCVNQVALALDVARMHERTRKKELEKEKLRAQTALLGSVFHDLYSPLKRVIDVFNDLINNKTTVEALIEANLDKDVHRLNRLNNNLYHIIRLESEAIAINKAPYSLEKIIKKAVKMLGKELESRPIEVVLPDEMPLVLLDSQWILEVMIHLLDNAIKFSSPQSKIYLSASIKNKTVEVSVNDTGVGIIPDEKTHVFKTFYRGKKVLSQHGLGLGLAICEKIIAAHGGMIWIDNIEGKGASVRFSLPLDPV